MMRVEANDEQKIAWVFAWKYALASFAYEMWGGRDAAISAAEGFTIKDGPLAALEPFVDATWERVADAPAWNDGDTVNIVVTIGDLRAAMAAYDA